MKKNKLRKVIVLGLSTALVSMGCLSAFAMNCDETFDKKDVGGIETLNKERLDKIGKLAKKLSKSETGELPNENGKDKLEKESKQVEKDNGENNESQVSKVESGSNESVKKVDQVKTEEPKAAETGRWRRRNEPEFEKSVYDIYHTSPYFQIPNQEVNGTTKPIMFKGVKPITEDEKRKIVSAERCSKVGKTISLEVTEANGMIEDSILTLPDGTKINEIDLRRNPGEYFRQDKETGMCYIKLGEELYEAGKFTIPTLGEISEEAQSKDRKDGKMFVVYADMGSSGLQLLDIQNILDSKKFDLANPASSHNCIETTYYDDYSPLSNSENAKLLSDYSWGQSSGPAFMLKCPWTSLCLLHMPGLNGMVYDETKGIYKETMGDKINLLYPYKVLTSAGYGISLYEHTKFGEDKKEDNDKFMFMGVEDAPISLDGGNIFPYMKQPYTYSKDSKKINIFLDAALDISSNDYGRYCESTRYYTAEQCKLHIKRHYLALFNYCKVKGIKEAVVSFIGIGESSNDLEWHKEALYDPEVKKAMRESGTTYIFNAYNRFDTAEVFKGQAINISSATDMSVFDRIIDEKWKV